MRIKIKKSIEIIEDDINIGEILRLIHYDLKIIPKTKDDLLKFEELNEDFYFEQFFDKKGNLRILF